MFKHKCIVNVPDSLMILNEDFDIIFTNQSWEKFNLKSARKSKKSRTGLTYLKIRKKATVEDRAREQQARKGILSVISGHVDHFEMEYPCHGTDELQWFLLRVTKIKEVEIMVLLTHIDITAIKLGKEKPAENLSDTMNGVQREEVDRRNEELSLSLSNIMEQTVDSLIVTDKDGIIIYANNAAIELTGYSQEELEGKEPTVLNSGKQSPKFYSNLWKTVRSGEVFRSVIINRKKNNELYFEETTVTPIKNDKNKITNFVFTGWDVSERMLAEESLKYSEEKLRTIYEFSRDAILVHDGTRLLDCNLATLKMYKCDSKKKFLALALEDLHPRFLPNGQPTSDVIKEQLAKVLVADTADFESISKRMDGTVFDSEISLIKMELKGKMVVQLIVRDISSQKIAEQNLVRSKEKFRALASRIERIREDERTLIARNIHDDLGHSLTALLLDLHLISKKPECQGNDIRVELKSMIGLTNRSIETTQKIAANLRPGILDKLGLSAALEWQLEAFIKRNDMKTNVSIQKYTTEQLNEEKTTAIFRVFQEILTNISRHAEATSLKVILKNGKENIRLFVSDNGIGIKNENINDINSLGLLGMEERTTIVGGKFSISSPKKGGTEINVTIPIAN